MNAVLLVLAGGVLGALIVWLVMRGKLHVAETILQERSSALEKANSDAMAVQEAHYKMTLEAQEARHKEAVDALETRHKEAVDALEARHKEAVAVQETHYKMTLEAQETRHKEAIAAQEARFEETLAKVTAQLRDATGEMLRQRQKEFQEASGQSIGQIVAPLRESIVGMQRVMSEAQTQRSADSGALKAIIQQMMQSSEEARKSTDELTRVFRRSNNVQGTWGETVLDELLEAQGLTRGVHYDVQPTMRDAGGTAVQTEQGQRLRPDVILHLDRQRDVIVDSKVSLAAFMDYVNATDEGERQRFLKAHVASLQDQVNRLAQKDYSNYVQPPKVKMDYVIMFVPHSAALWTALNAQPDLWRNAMAQNVFIADEQTLFAALRIINLTWTQIAQAQNHEKVYALANELLDRVGQFMKKYEDIGTALERAAKAYEDGGRKLAPTGQSILTTCAKLQKLGAKQSDKNPLPQIVDIDDVPQLEVDS